MNEFKNLLTARAASWADQSSRASMNYDELVTAFITEFHNPLVQNVVENVISNLKRDLGENKYCSAISNLNTKFNEIGEKSTDQTSFIELMYAEIIPHSLHNLLIMAFGTRYLHDNTISLGDVQSKAYTLADAHQQHWVQIKKLLVTNVVVINVTMLVILPSIIWIIVTVNEQI